MLNRELVLEHYKEQANKWKDDPRSTMEDETTREFEVAKIKQTIELIIDNLNKEEVDISICDLGCGNGYTLKELVSTFPSNFVGIDLSEEMLAVARSRELKNCQFIQADITQSNGLPGSSFDIIYTERCLVNVLDENGQYSALRNIWKLLNRGGYYIMLESFRDGLDLTNKARAELGLEPISAPYHNLFFDKSQFLSFIKDFFRIVDVSELCQDDQDEYAKENFLSSYYFISRVVYPSITHREIMRNTEFVKFFSFLPPIGNYAPNQCYILQKIDGAQR